MIAPGVLSPGTNSGQGLNGLTANWMTRYGELSPGPVFHWLMNTRSSSSVDPGEMKPPYGCASRLSSGAGRSSAGSGHVPATTTVVTGAAPSPVGSAATRTSILPLLAL